jgi:uncharacterized protein YdgA (DUF945 family)
MRKSAVAVLAIVVLALLALPEIYGRLTENRIKALVADRGRGAWTAEIKSYERGWFRSRVVIELALSNAYVGALGGPSSPLGGHLPVAIHIAHGPVAVLDGVYFGWSKVVARADRSAQPIAELEQQLGVPQLFEVRSRTAFLGETSFDGEVAKFELPVEDGSVHFSGGSFAGTFQRNRLRSDGHIDSVELSSPLSGLTLHGLRAAVDADIQSRAVPIGTSSVEVDDFAVTNALSDAYAVGASKLKFGWKAALDGARLGIETSYDIASMTVANVTLTDASIGIGVRNVDLEAYEAYRDAVEDFLESQDPEPMQAAVTRLIAAKPTVTLEPVRVLADGELFEARLDLTPNDRAAADFPAVLADPAGLAGAFDGSAQVDISRRLAERIAQQALRMQFAGDPSIPEEQLDQMVAAQSGAVLLMLAGQGIVETSGTGYRANIELADGELKLNGRPMPLP